MKILIFTLLITFFILSLFSIFTRQVLGHSGGIPFVKINGQNTKVYTKEEFAYINDVPIPSDIAPENYLIGQKISFEVDPEKLSYPKEVTDQATYTWDFGDGFNIKGKKVEHSFAKKGTYTVNVEIDYGDLSRFGFFAGDSPPPYQSILVHIFPDSNYKLPQPVIKINDQLPEIISISSGSASDSAIISRNNLKFDLNNRLIFNASDSKPGTTKIVKYSWDFGQGEESSKETDTFRYKLPQYYVTAILRVEDENGFFADAFVDLQNSGKNEENNPELEESLKFIGMMTGTIFLTVVLGISGTILYKKLKKKN